MSSAAALSVGIRGTEYPVLLPSVRDARLHLAALIVSLQVLGQTAFGFRLSIAQILISIGTCAVLEVAITAARQRVLMWPASALLTGNGVAFVLRVPGTRHGDWWSLHGAWIFAATAAVSLLSKHVLRVHGKHVFNPSNIGLVLCFLVLGRSRAEPLDFWWGPMSAWLALALAIIVLGGLAILLRLGLLSIAVSFWLAFAGALAVVAAAGHAMTARWHLGPIEGFRFWKVLATSPELLVFLFFMLTDPKTIPERRRPRIAYAVSTALLAVLLIAPARTEFWAKVAVLGALALVCLARPLIAAATPQVRLAPRTLAAVAAATLAAYAAVLLVAGLPARPVVAAAAPARPRATLPAIVLRHSSGVDALVDHATAHRIASDLVAAERSRGQHVRRIELWLEAGSGQAPLIVARVHGDDLDETDELGQSGPRYVIARVRPPT